jgi:4,5-dihydroxyphthalate decarboxylase
VPPLSIALGDYGLTRPLKEGGVPPGRLSLDFVPVEPITAAMRRMVRGLEFDICEMAFTTYLCAKALGKPIIALPVFLTRNFHHRAAVYTEASRIAHPKELEGRAVAVNRGYTVTTGLWARGILGREYGLDLDKVTWLPTDDEHVAEYRAPANVDYSCRGKSVTELLLSGRCDAAIGDIRAESPAIRALIPDAREAGFASFRRTGLYPLNHAVVVKTALIERHPTLATDLAALFTAAKAQYLAHLARGTDLSAADRTAQDLAAVVGDPFPYGIDANRTALEAILDFAYEQHVTPSRLSLDALFAPIPAAAFHQQGAFSP